MFFFKTFINETLACGDLKLLGYEALGVRHILMCYIGKSPVTDYLYRTETEPYTDEELMKLLGLQLHVWLHIKGLLLKHGGFAEDDKKAIGIPMWSAKYQSDYYRQKKYRKKKKVTPKVTTKVTPRSKKVEERNQTLEVKGTTTVVDSGSSGERQRMLSAQEKRVQIETLVQNLAEAHAFGKGRSTA